MHIMKKKERKTNSRSGTLQEKYNKNILKLRESSLQKNSFLGAGMLIQNPAELKMTNMNMKI